MAGFEELIERLLHDLALAGKKGFSANQFETAVKSFYDEKNQIQDATAPGTVTGEDLLFSDAPPVEKVVVDETLLNSVLDWLIKHPDVIVKDDQRSIGEEPSEAATSDSTFRSKLGGKRISTTEDRVWQAITGHGIDHKRLPSMEFEILCVIAASGPGGILQPYVTKLTGQDKRSVPKRTDLLRDKGYIVKDTVIGSGQKTSSLRLKKYVVSRIPDVAPQAEPGSTIGSRPVIYYDAWFDDTMALLKSNNNIVTMKDLRLHLGVPMDSWARKVLIRCVRRLAEGGCVRRLTARIHDSDGNPLAVTANGSERRAKTIQLMREPTAFDRQLWSKSDPHKKLSKEDSSDEEFDSQTPADDDQDAAASDEEGVLVEIDEGQDDLDRLPTYVPPQWTPNIPLPNLVHDAVDSAGQRGLTTTELNTRLTGPLWRRPLDEVASRLTDVPLQSQPSHLKHFSLVRDNTIRNRQTVSNLRTISNFEKAVGAGEASREALLDPKKPGKENEPGIDAWGFTKVPLKELSGRDGRATLAEGRQRLATEVLEGADGVVNANSVAEVRTPGAKRKRGNSALGPSPSGNAQETNHTSPRKRQRMQESMASGHANRPAADVGNGMYANFEVRQYNPGQPANPASTSKVSPQKSRLVRPPKPKPANPQRPAVAKKREIPQEDFEEFEAAAELTAKRQVMTEVKAGKKRAWEEAGLDNLYDTLQEVNVEELPQDRVKQVTAEIIAQQRPGIYINPPGARNLKAETFVRRGRPRKALIAVIKTDRLKTLPWFKDEGGPRVAPPPRKSRSSSAGKGAMLSASRIMPGDSDSEQESHPASRKRQRNGEATDGDLAMTDVPLAYEEPAMADTDPEATLPVTAIPTATTGQAPVSTDEGHTEAAETVLPTTETDIVAPKASEPADLTAPIVTANGEKTLPATSDQGSDVPPSTVTQPAPPTVDSDRAPMPVAIASKTPVNLNSEIDAEGGSQSENVTHDDTHPKTAPKPSGELELVSAAAPQPQPQAGPLMPPTQQTVSAKLPGRRVNPAEILTKEYVMQHPNEDFYHRGKGIWVRGLPPSDGSTSWKAAVSGPGAATWKAQMQNMQQNNAPKASRKQNKALGQNHAASEHAGTGSQVASTSVLSTLQGSETTSRPEVLQKASEEQQSALLGLSAVAPPVANDRLPISEAMPSAQPNDGIVPSAVAEATSVPKTQTSQDARVDVSGAPGIGTSASNSLQTGDAPAAPATADAVAAQPVSALQSSAIIAPSIASMVLPASQVVRPQDLVTREYVDEHPNETFFHRGQGRWARGLPPMDFSTKTGVRGPLAQEWKAQAKALFDAKKTGTKNKPVSNKPASLIVKLPVSGTKLDNTGPQPRLNSTQTQTGVHLPTPAKEPSTPKASTDSTSLPAPIEAENQNQVLQTHEAVAPPVALAKIPFLNIVRPYTPRKEADVPAPSSELQEPQRHATEQVFNDTRVAEPSSEAMAMDLDVPQTTDDIEPSTFPPAQQSSQGTEVPRDQDQIMADSSEPAEALDTAVALAASGASTQGVSIFAQRQQVILDAIHACGGVFPGNDELWYVSATAWKKLYNTEPDRDTIEQVIKKLVGSKLKKLTFQFRNKKGENLRRSILTEIGVDTGSLVVRKMQKRIIEAYPSLYLPPEVEVDDELRKKVSNQFSKTAGSNIATAFEQDGFATVRQTQQSALMEQAALTSSPKSRKVSIGRGRGGIRRATLDSATSRGRKRQHSESEDEDDGIVSAEQAAMQNEYQLASYRHDPSAMVPLRRPDSRVQISKRLRIDVRPWQPSGAPPKKQKQTRRSRDVEGGLTLDDVARHHRNAASLLLHPEQTYHAASGTFATMGIIASADIPEQRTLRGRSSLTKDESKSNLAILDEYLLQAEEDIQPSSDESEAQSSEPDGDNESLVVKLKVPGLASASITDIQQPSNESTAPQQNIASAASTVTAARPKRKYKSRAKPAQVEEEFRESDGEFVPDVDAPDNGTPKKRSAADGGIPPKRDRRSVAIFKDADRTVIAMALVSAVCGGLAPERFNWSLVAHALSYRYDGNFLRQRWSHLRNTRKGDVDKLRGLIHEPFLEAYANDRLPRVDFQNLNQTDWPALFEWVEQNVVQKMAHEESNTFQLPESRDKLEDESLVAVDGPNFFDFSRNEYFTTNTHLQRKHLATSYNNSNPVIPQKRHDNLQILKSLIRATAITKGVNYNAEAATKRLRSFEAGLENGINELVGAKIISQEKSGRHLPGRNYHLHKDVLPQLRKWQVKHSEEHAYLREVATAYQVINSHFKQHDKLQLAPASSDPEYLVLTNMVAQGWLRVTNILPERKDELDAPHPKLSPWTYGGKNYETKKVPISDLKFLIVYVKTAAYNEAHGLTTGVAIPQEGQDGRVPFWTDIHGNFVDEHWDIAVRSVLNLLVFRAGITSAQMQSAHNNKLWTWEIEMLLQWMEQVGIAARCGFGEENDQGVWKEGWRAADNWFCAFLPEIATWKAPTAADF